MRGLLLLLLFILLAPAVTFAQGNGYARTDDMPVKRETSVLSVFSENGEQFFLVLNGIKQNTLPQSRIRVEGLPEYNNNLQIIFADDVTPELQQKIAISDPIDGRAANMTLAIIRNRENNARLKFFMLTPVDHNYRAVQNEYIMYYGHPQQQGGNTETVTTYTDPNTGQVVTQTTTNTHIVAPPPVMPPAPTAMDRQSFSDAMASISSASFDDTKMSVAKTIVGSNYVSTDQVIQICKLFSFSSAKLDFSKYAYSRTVDQNNYYKVGNAFDFDSERQSLNDFISKGGR